MCKIGWGLQKKKSITSPLCSASLVVSNFHSSSLPAHLFLRGLQNTMRTAFFLAIVAAILALVASLVSAAPTAGDEGASAALDAARLNRRWVASIGPIEAVDCLDLLVIANITVCSFFLFVFLGTSRCALGSVCHIYLLNRPFNLWDLLDIQCRPRHLDSDRRQDDLQENKDDHQEEDYYQEEDYDQEALCYP